MIYIFLVKGKKTRLIPLLQTRLLKLFLKQMIKNCPFEFSGNNYIFLGKRGKKLKAEIIQKEIRKIRNTLMLPEQHNTSFIKAYFCNRPA